MGGEGAAVGGERAGLTRPSHPPLLAHAHIVSQLPFPSPNAHTLSPPLPTCADGCSSRISSASSARSSQSVSRAGGSREMLPSARAASAAASAFGCVSA
eukprot:scaffold14257_cov79-Isochrysis_galbana.AAC.2